MQLLEGGACSVPAGDDGWMVAFKKGMTDCTLKYGLFFRPHRTALSASSFIFPGGPGYKPDQQFLFEQRF
jgi:hypothetical protein